MKLFRRIILSVLAVVLSVGSFVSCGGVDPDELIVKDLDWAVGAPLPKASDFVVDLPEGVEATFAENYTFDSMGVYELEIVLSSGLSKSTRNVKMNLRIDNTPPTILGVKDVEVYIGEGVSYKNGITVTDDCGGEVTLTVDSSAVDPTREGEYTVRYIARDAVGNTSTAKAKVYVSKIDVSQEMLNQKLDAVIAQIITPDMSKVARCQAVYSYVWSKIEYTSDSEKGDWISAAYYALDKGRGDCYNYAMLSKAFLDRLGIENRTIQRTPAATAAMGETHYWNYVNVGESGNAQWYHFDTTHLRDVAYNGKLVLVTEEQLQYYNTRVRRDDGNFYAYDRTGYPAPATAKITSLPYEG
ncbi:MAG: transglutaminase domain-containing protein [Clostridia bacterium]|nr:transglutaminase domain-containing protein [Clostridia bacterium]